MVKQVLIPFTHLLQVVDAGGGQQNGHLDVSLSNVLREEHPVVLREELPGVRREELHGVRREGHPGVRREGHPGVRREGLYGERIERNRLSFIL